MHQLVERTTWLSVIVPAHNEEHRIQRTLADLRSALPTAEICVVANNCTDRTVEILRGIALHDPLLTFADIPAVVGKGGAVRVGFNLARGDVVAFVDADGATPAEELRRLVDVLGNADGVIASRWKKGAIVETQQSLKRRILSRGFNYLIRVLFKLPYCDTQCGAKIFKRSAIQDAMESVETSDFSFDVDLLYQLRRLDKCVKEEPSHWADRAGSSVDVKTAVPRMFASMVRLRLKYSPFRFVVPLLDRLAKLKPIAARRTLDVLVLSEHSPHSAATSVIEHEFFETCSKLRGERYRFTYCAAAALSADRVEKGALVKRRRLARLRLPFLYLSTLKDRFDCVIELSPTGRLWWTPLFSLKPKLVFSPLRDRLPAIYGKTRLARAVPSTAMDLAELIDATIIRGGPRLCAQADGSWILIERGNDLSVRRLPLLLAPEGVNVGTLPSIRLEPLRDTVERV